MRRANQEVPSKLLLITVCCVLTSMLCAPGALGDTIFFDNFNDGDAQDGMPVTWVPSSGTWNASTGDYVATGSLPSRISRVSDRVFGDISARTQARVVGNVSATLAVRQGNQGYAGTIQPNGSMAIVRLDAPDSPIFLASAVVPFNPVQQDVMLQFDAFGAKLSLWAWQVGQPMPNEPQIVAFDNTYAEGPVGLVSAAFAASPSDSTTFRFIHVANTHIPEPSTFALISLGGCGLLYARRRKRA